MYLVEVVQQERAVAEPVQEAPAAAPPEHVAGIRVKAVAVHSHLPVKRRLHSTDAPGYITHATHALYAGV